jgi:hypothetical protein
MLVKISDIVRDAGTQSRVALDEEVVAQMVADLRDGDTMPPVFLFRKGGIFYPGDGFHRIEALIRVGRDQVEARIAEGDARAAFLYALDNNNGKPLALEDRKACAQRLLVDPAWSQWSDRAVGRRCGMDHVTIGKMRRKLSGENHQIAKTKENDALEDARDTPKQISPAGAAVIPIASARNNATQQSPSTATRTAERGGTRYEVSTETIGKRRGSKNRHARVCTKANTIIRGTAVEKDSNQRRKLGRLPTGMQQLVAKRIKNGESSTVDEAVRDIAGGAPISKWERAWAAVMDLSDDDIERICRQAVEVVKEKRQSNQGKAAK